MTHYYYSIYRKDYLYKGLVLYESMRRYDEDFKFFLVCMDEESYELLNQMNNAGMVPINIKEIEEYDKRIPELKVQRGEKTYIWTAKASVALYLFEHYSDIDHVIWLDGDTEFMSSPDPIYEQWGDFSVLLTEEKFEGTYEYLGHMVGFYNTGFMGFKKDQIGINCLKYFKERLQEWKNSEEDQGNWNDQLYVDDWTVRFPNVGVVNHNGINLTPFIAGRMNTEQNGFVNLRDGRPYINDVPIVLYHFMALKYYDGNEFDLCYYWMKFDIQTIKKLYIPYFIKCNEAYARIREIKPDFYPPMTTRGKYIGNYFNYKVNSIEGVNNICTITNTNHLAETISLYNSIKKYNIRFRLWICCEDENSYNILKQLNLSEIQIFEPANLIENYCELKRNGYEANSRILKARLINMLLLNNYSLLSMLYVDCNCYFHQNPKHVFDLIKKNSIVLVEDKSVLGNKQGLSSSMLGFNRDQTTLDCLFYWVEETKQWLEKGVSPQEEINYISKWSERFSKVYVIKNLIYILNEKVLKRVEVKRLNEKLFINNEALVLYKYELDTINESTIKNIMEKIFKSSDVNKKHIYMPYLKSINSSIDMLRGFNEINLQK